MFVNPQSTDPKGGRGHAVDIGCPLGSQVGLLEPAPSRPQIANLVQCVVAVADQRVRIVRRMQLCSTSPVHLPRSVTPRRSRIAISAHAEQDRISPGVIHAGRIHNARRDDAHAQPALPAEAGVALVNGGIPALVIRVCAG